MNDVGKPCARDPHARFDRGPLAKRATGRDARETQGPACGTTRHTDQPAAYLTLVGLTGKTEDFGEWPYFFSLFGNPSADEPWGWQIDGHHLNLNALVLGDQLVLTPSFMGSEPCWTHEGPNAGQSIFGPEERAGLNLIRSLDGPQQARAVLHPSIAPGDLPPELSHPIDGRMVAGAFKDNAVVRPSPGSGATS